MEPEYLIDTNIVIGFFNKSLPESGKRLLSTIDPCISIITFIELFSTRNVSVLEMEQLKVFSSNALILNLDKDIALITMDIRADFNLKLPDAVIAATAIYHHKTLLSRNVSDFSKVKGLNVINPFEIV